ncbi:ATPase [Altererythrobacter sp. MF3-039]|uniref:F0F1 ATP synthase subunit B family protein n=1 Tax=Altererythrobacter sp. MF3-039 TaxID=3252901 RepID=UPI00390C58D8
MPQLDQLALAYQSQWFWLALVLGTIFIVVGMWIVPRVEKTVDDRDSSIEADLAEAQRLQDEAEASEEAWRAKVNEARADAQSVMAEAKAKAQADIEKKVGKADKEIAVTTEAAEAELDAARAAALTEIEEVAAQAAKDIVAKLTGAEVSEAEARQAVTGAFANA